MNIEISKEKSTVPFGIYRIKKDYIAFLKAKDDNVLDPDYTDRYCGPVRHVETERGPIDYFAPILPDYDEIKNIPYFLPVFNQGIACGFVDVKKAIPCLEKNITKDNSDEKLLQLCSNAQEFIICCTKKVDEILRSNKKGHNNDEKLDISYEESNTPFGIYRIKKDYIAALKQYSNNILDPNFTNRYCGPVFCLNTASGPTDYFVPIDPSYDKIECLLISFCDNIIAGFMNTNSIIPCPKEYIKRDDTDEGLSSTCECMKDFIEDCAKHTYEKSITQN